MHSSSLRNAVAGAAAFVWMTGYAQAGIVMPDSGVLPIDYPIENPGTVLLDWTYFLTGDANLDPTSTIRELVVRRAFASVGPFNTNSGGSFSSADFPAGGLDFYIQLSNESMSTGDLTKFLITPTKGFLTGVFVRDYTFPLFGIPEGGRSIREMFFAKAMPTERGINSTSWQVRFLVLGSRSRQGREADGWSSERMQRTLSPG